MFVHFFANNAVSRSSLSDRFKSECQPFDDRIQVSSGGYSVTSTKDNTPYDTDSVNFGSMASAEEYMNNIISESPEMADALHTIPNNEVNITV